jgi:hypothetical protein
MRHEQLCVQRVIVNRPVAAHQPLHLSHARPRVAWTRVVVEEPLQAFSSDRVTALVCRRCYGLVPTTKRKNTKSERT